MIPLMHGITGSRLLAGNACLSPSGLNVAGDPFSFAPVECVAVSDTETISYRHSGYTMYAHSRDSNDIYSQTATYYAGAFGSYNTIGVRAAEKEALMVSGWDLKMRTMRIDGGVLSLDTSSVSAPLPELPSAWCRIADNFAAGIGTTTRRLFIVDRVPGAQWGIRADIDIDPLIPSTTNGVAGIGSIGPYILVHTHTGHPNLFIYLKEQDTLYHM